MNPLIYAVLSYGSWGIIPIYWKLLAHLPAGVTMSGRVVWSAAFLILFLSWRGKAKDILYSLHPARVWPLLLSAGFIGANWLVYVHAVNTNHIVDASLGYFFSPLLQVGLGRFIFKEKLSVPQLVAFWMAFLGVVVVAISKSTFPVVGLFLAITFVAYSAVRKMFTSGLNPVMGLTLETAVLAPWAMTYLLSRPDLSISLPDHGLLMGAGLLTCFPFLWFATALRQLPLRTMGFAQYISPTLQFLVGAVVFREPLNSGTLWGFVFVWIGCAIYLFSLLRAR